MLSYQLRATSIGLLLLPIFQAEGHPKGFDCETISHTLVYVQCKKAMSNAKRISWMTCGKTEPSNWNVNNVSISARMRFLHRLNYKAEMLGPKRWV